MAFKNYNHAWIKLASPFCTCYYRQGLIHTKTQTIHRIKTVSSDSHESLLSRSYCLSYASLHGGRKAWVQKRECLLFQLNLCPLSNHVGIKRWAKFAAWGVVRCAVGWYGERGLRFFTCRHSLGHCCQSRDRWPRCPPHSAVGQQRCPGGLWDCWSGWRPGSGSHSRDRRPQQQEAGS